MIRFLKRNVTTALTLPVAALWDAVSLCNAGEGSSTAMVVRRHLRQANHDEVLDLIEDVRHALEDK